MTFRVARNANGLTVLKIGDQFGCTVERTSRFVVAPDEEYAFVKVHRKRFCVGFVFNQCCGNVRSMLSP